MCILLLAFQSIYPITDTEKHLDHVLEHVFSHSTCSQIHLLDKTHHKSKRNERGVSLVEMIDEVPTIHVLTLKQTTRV